MSLEINKNDSSFDTRELSQKKIGYQRKIAGLLVLMTLFSGSLIGPIKVYATETTPMTLSETYVEPSTIIEIPEVYQYTVADLCGKEKGEPITVGDLNAVKENFLTISVYDEANLEWLNYVGQVDRLTFIIHAADTSVLRKINKLNNIKNITISSPPEKVIEINGTDFNFLRRSTKTKELSLTGEVGIEPGFLESLKHLKKLSLCFYNGNHVYDCSKLTFLDKLELNEPYTAAVNVTQDEYELLTKNGVKITFSDDGDLEKFKEINKRLDEIVDGLNIDENSSDQEKFDAIVCYVLDNLTYDPEVKEAIYNNKPSEDLTRKFYEDGTLYGALEIDTAICGNYAALTNALAERVGLDSYYLTSHSHAWSLIEVEGKQYYVDTTWLDSPVQKIEKKEFYDELGRLDYVKGEIISISPTELIKEGKTDELEWYMEDPESYPKSEEQVESHIVVNLPSFFGINPQEESGEPKVEESVITTEPLETEPQDVINLDGKEIEVKLGNKTWFIAGGAAIGVLLALGGAVAVNKKKEVKRKQRQRQRNYSEPFSSPYDNSFGYNSNLSFDDLFEDEPNYTGTSNNKKRR